MKFDEILALLTIYLIIGILIFTGIFIKSIEPGFGFALTTFGIMAGMLSTVIILITKDRR